MRDEFGAFEIDLNLFWVEASFCKVIANFKKTYFKMESTKKTSAEILAVKLTGLPCSCVLW